MKHSVDAVREAADDQQMLVGIVLSRMSESESRTESVADLTKVCIKEADRMIEAARGLNETTKRFVV